MTTLPPFPPSAQPTTILASPAHITISAPASVAFSLLTTPATWSTWNSFAPRVDVTFHPNPTSPAQLVPGTKLTMHAIYDPAAPSYQKGDIHIQVKSVGYDADTKCHHVVWTLDGWAPWFFNAERRQEIYELGDEECEYRSWEEMAGWMAYFVKYVWPGRRRLWARFADWARGLKVESERVWNEKKKGKK